MPISATGNRARGAAGVTLMELMVALAIIAMIIGIALPNTIAGLENIRLSTGARSVAAFMTSASNRAQRREQALELTVFVKENAMILRSPDAGFVRRLNLPSGIAVQAVWPPLLEPTDEPRRFLFLPGGSPPRIGIEIANRRGARRIVRLDPITGVTQIEQPEPE